MRLTEMDANEIHSSACDAIVQPGSQILRQRSSFRVVETGCANPVVAVRARGLRWIL